MVQNMHHYLIKAIYRLAILVNEYKLPHVTLLFKWVLLNEQNGPPKTPKFEAPIIKRTVRGCREEIVRSWDIQINAICSLLYEMIEV